MIEFEMSQSFMIISIIHDGFFFSLKSDGKWVSDIIS